MGQLLRESFLVHPNVDISFAKLDLERTWICFLYFGRRRIVFLDYIPIWHL